MLTSEPAEGNERCLLTARPITSPDSQGLEWFLQRLPKPKEISLEVVTNEAKRRVESISAHFTQLNDIITHYEDVIRTRWTKKSQDQRLQVLLAAWPDMAKEHRPEWKASRFDLVQQKFNHPKYRDYYLWPAINQEDLLQTQNLLLLADSRGRSHPSVFAAVDGSTMTYVFQLRLVIPAKLPGYKMLLNGAPCWKEYGRLLGRGNKNSVDDQQFMWRQFPPGRGLLVLEVQDRLLRFLVQCCRKILHDINNIDTSLPMQESLYLDDQLNTRG